MSSLLTSQGMVLATAMAVSGTVILYLCRQKALSDTQLLMGQNPTTPTRNLRSCISSDGKKREKKKKRVHFSDDDVVHHYPPIRGIDNEEIEISGEIHSSLDVVTEHVWVSVDPIVPRMPANRMALYNGIRQDRLQRMACSY